MEIVIREPEEVQDVQRTAGFASEYQMTNITTTGTLAVATTVGVLLVGDITFPRHLPLPLTQPPLQMHPRMVEGEDELAEGYKAMAAENSRLAEEFLPAALEEWPMWEA